MNKKLIFVGSLAAALFLGGCSGQMAQLVGSNAGSMLASTAGSVDKTNRNCIPRMSGGSVGFMGMASKLILTPLLESAIKEATGVEDMKLPTPITNTCDADNRLVYLKKITDNFSNSLDDINSDIASSLVQTKKIQEFQSLIDQRKRTVNEADLDGAVENNEKLLLLVKDAKVKDKAKYSAAMGKLALATPARMIEIIGWDKEIAEFSKDNMVWGIKNVSSVKDILSQLTSFTSIVPTVTSLTSSPMYKGRVDKNIALKASKQAIKDNKEVAQEAENEMDEA